MKHILLLLTASAFINARVAAQTEKIDTDRPDQTESVFTVPKKFIQSEFGLVAEKLNAYQTNYTSPTILTKYGLTKKTEIRLITEWGFNDSKLLQYNVPEITTPLQLGFKTSLSEEKGLLPKTSLIVHSALQNIKETGKKNKKEIAGNFRFTLQNSITKNIAIGYNIGMQWESFNEMPAYVYTFAPGFNLSDKWYCYLEAFGTIMKDNEPENSVDAGLAYYATDNLKIDISAGKGISSAAPRYYLGAGFSFRFKTGR